MPEGGGGEGDAAVVDVNETPDAEEEEDEEKGEEHTGLVISTGVDDGEARVDGQARLTG